MTLMRRVDTPLGGVTLLSDGESLTWLLLDGQRYFPKALVREAAEAACPVFEEAKRWLEAYFSGQIPDFMPPLAPRGTPFRRAVWSLLLTIPYGQTVTYGELAERIAGQLDIPRMSAQAVGGAVGHNPIPLIIPCHRVIGADGRLTGYGGGLERKRALLRLEGIDLDFPAPGGYNGRKTI